MKDEFFNVTHRCNVQPQSKNILRFCVKTPSGGLCYGRSGAQQTAPLAQNSVSQSAVHLKEKSSFPFCAFSGLLYRKSRSTMPGLRKHPFFLAVTMGIGNAGRVILSAIIVGGTSKGRLSEFFKKELRDVSGIRGRGRFLTSHFRDNKRQFVCFFVLWSSAACKIVVYSLAVRSSLVGEL